MSELTDLKMDVDTPVAQAALSSGDTAFPS
jgi:hypothetical protein